MKLGEYFEQAVVVYATVKDGRGSQVNLMIDKHQVMNEIVPDEMDENVPEWDDKDDMEMLFYPIMNSGWVFKIKRYFYPIHNIYDYRIDLIAEK
jgi:hypothetical protein